MKYNNHFVRFNERQEKELNQILAENDQYNVSFVLRSAFDLYVKHYKKLKAIEDEL